MSDTKITDAIKFAEFVERLNAEELELENNRLRRALAGIVSAYEREVRPAKDWSDTALTESEFNEATAEYRAAKELL